MGRHRAEVIHSSTDADRVRSNGSQADFGDGHVPLVSGLALLEGVSPRRKKRPAVAVDTAPTTSDPRPPSLDPFDKEIALFQG